MSSSRKPLEKKESVDFYGCPILKWYADYMTGNEILYDKKRVSNNWKLGKVVKEKYQGNGEMHLFNSNIITDKYNQWHIIYHIL